MDATRETASDTPNRPGIGEIYRDKENQSFIVLSVNQGRFLVEFADGRVKRITMEQWRNSNPRPAPF